MKRTTGFVSLRLAFYYAAFFAVVGISMPYWPVWLESRGLDPVDIGIVLAVGRWASIVTTPMVAQFADRSGERKRLLILLTCGLFLSYLLYGFAVGFWAILVIAIPAAMFRGAINPVGDSLTMTNAARGRTDYGRVRLWGSVTFILASFAGGEMLARWDEDIVLWAILVLIGLGVVSCFFLPDTAVERAPKQRGAFWLLVRNPVILCFLATLALLSSSHAVIYAFGTLHWRQAGVSDRMIGLLWSEGVVAEIVLFAFGAAVVRRIGVLNLMLLASIGGLIRWTLLGTSTELPVLLSVQALHGLTFGAAHLGAMHFIAQAAPAGYSATVQSLYNAIAMSAAIAIAVPLSGPLFEAVGGKAYFAMTALSVAGGCGALILRGLWNGERLALPEARPPI